MAHSPRAELARRCGLLVALLLAPIARAETALEASLRFARRSEPVASWSLDRLRQAVEPARVRVHEPYEGREVSFEALPLSRVLDAVYTPSWREEEELLFTCRDGYQPTVPVARVLAHRPWLAFERADAPGFTIQKRESGAVVQVELAPFYLIWENLDDARVWQEADYGWPYQLVAVDLIRSRDRFPRLAPPPGASGSVRAGFAAFRIHCSKCHKLNGEGGGIGPELNAGVSLVELRDRSWLRTWIEDPSRIRPDTRMPALNPQLPERARTTAEIIAYLEAMAAAKRAAAER